MTSSKTRAAKAQFGRQAERYAESPVHIRAETLSVIVELANPTRKDFVLDVATGPGFTAFEVARSAGAVIATDITAPMINCAKRIAKERRVSNVFFQFAEAGALPFGDRTFDIITCRSAPHHFTDLPAFLRESARILKDGGRLVVSDPSSPEDKEIDRWLNRVESIRDPSHVRNYTVKEWRKMVEGAGLVIKSERMDVPHNQSFAKWMDTAGVEPDAREELRGIFLSASDKTKRTFGIAQAEGDGIVFHWNAYVFRAERP